MEGPRGPRRREPAKECRRRRRRQASRRPRGAMVFRGYQRQNESRSNADQDRPRRSHGQLRPQRLPGRRLPLQHDDHRGPSATTHLHRRFRLRSLLGLGDGQSRPSTRLVLLPVPPSQVTPPDLPSLALGPRRHGAHAKPRRRTRRHRQRTEASGWRILLRIQRQQQPKPKRQQQPNRVRRRGASGASGARGAVRLVPVEVGDDVPSSSALASQGDDPYLRGRHLRGRGSPEKVQGPAAPGVPGVDFAAPEAAERRLRPGGRVQGPEGRWLPSAAGEAQRHHMVRICQRGNPRRGGNSPSEATAGDNSHASAVLEHRQGQGLGPVVDLDSEHVLRRVRRPRPLGPRTPRDSTRRSHEDLSTQRPPRLVARFYHVLRQVRPRPRKLRQARRGFTHQGRSEILRRQVRRPLRPSHRSPRQPTGRLRLQRHLLLCSVVVVVVF
mmetsp:Transcript_27809/g.89715  ORF Transcript_27809/g.89715 Transcript_27809/m.89715 type:complete len:440 (+) Transcript_27809:570-1889(+)